MKTAKSNSRSERRKKFTTDLSIQLSSSDMIESCCAVTSYYCFKCVHGVSVVLISQRPTWTSKAKVHSRSFNLDGKKKDRTTRKAAILKKKKIA